MKGLIIVMMMLALSGCATNPETGERELTDGGTVMVEAAIRASTARVIRTSSVVDADRVIEGIRDIRARVDLDGTITTDELMATAEAVFNFERLLPEERELIRGIMALAQERIDSDRIGVVSARADEVLTWIEGAAITYR